MVFTRSSSAPSTPAGKTTNAVDTTATAPQSTPRKVPHCSKCHRPRAGHPRQGCPYVDSPAPAKVEEYVTDAFESLHIESQETKVTPQRRLGSSPAKPTPVPEPGMMGDEIDEDERRASITRWQNMIATPTKLKVSTRMPGALISPSTTNSSLVRDGLSSLVDTKKSLHPADDEKKPSVRMPGAIFSPSTTSIAMEPTSVDLVATQEVLTASRGGSASEKKLMRSMSVEERHAFLNDLVTTSKAPPATVFVLPMDEIPAARQSATKLGFYCRVHDLENGEGWLIIGMDAQAVEDLFDGMEGGTKETKKTSGGLRAVVGGAIAGGVATWTGLAYA